MKRKEFCAKCDKGSIERPKKVIVLGSGALKIGEAGEFDYSGSQAIKALKEEGIKVVLVNPNIATIQTSEHLADKVYFLPITAYFVERVIEKEKPDGILLSFGGQTALNCGVELYNSGILQKNNVKVLGTPVKTIIDTEDRELFVRKLDEIGVKTPRSEAARNIDQAIEIAQRIGYPVMVRIAYALGGLGSGVAYNEQSLKDMLSKAFSYTQQLLVEEYLHGWKEIEYEVVRDRMDNCITVCNMENMDPMGIHTGESIVVAPSQTLTNYEYHMLREVSIKAIRHLGVIGECNIQFALNPKNSEYRVIEVNARLSRSSALASKATGYPLAFIAAKLSIGYTLTQLRNSITQITTACFEPALDYCVVKIPRWDLKKFVRVSKKIGSSMMSVGEVMAIGRKFEEALQKAIRMLEIGANGVVCNDNILCKDIDEELANPTDERVFAIAQALKQGYSTDQIYSLSKIDKWFLHKISNIVNTEKELRQYTLETVHREVFLKAKSRGFSDKQIGICLGCQAKEVKEKRKSFGILPCIKQIDTLAAEYPAKTNYLYLTYNGSEDDVTFSRRKSVIVLGSGAYRIGSSVEFDWCCVNAVISLRKLGYETIMINYNPETVSTDYDICDRLYFDELSIESVMDIYDKEQPDGIIISMGGQIPNNLALKLHFAGAKIIGTHPKDIDRSEDRYKFSKLLDEIGVDQPEWKELTNLDDAQLFSQKVGYPVLVRPSYVLSGAAMRVAANDSELKEYLSNAAEVNKEHPVVISKFIRNAKEIEVDAVAKNGSIVIWALSEHVEKAGVHSGDATIIFPPNNTYLETARRVKKITQMIAQSLNITGPFNIQYLAKENEIKVIECNLRASRSFPFVSKVSKQNFIDLAVRAMLSKKVRYGISTLDMDYVGVKSPQFSFTRLKMADPIIGVEMASTGEVACLGDNLNSAFLKSILATGLQLPKKNVLLSISDEENKFRLLDSIKKLYAMGFNLFATEHTFEFLRKNGLVCQMVLKAHNTQKENALTMIEKKQLDFVIMIPDHGKREAVTDGYLIRRKAVDHAVPLLTDTSLTKLFVDAISKTRLEDLEIKAWDEY
ncbi:MAG: carbamoyl-phosphate synthase (glutamine-hydrolyzing) large subunit [Candidatus Woesearchaeota archaeon]